MNIGIFNYLYEFFFVWLFNGVYPANLTTQGVELTCIAFTVVTLISCISLVLIPLKWLLRLILN